MSRRGARLAAVETLYAADVRGVTADELLEERDSADPADPYTLHLVRSVGKRLAEIDDLLRGASPDWSLERMSSIDRNVLRIAILELLEGEVPPAAVIDEAVRIAKRFSGERAGSFVNGVLSAILAARTGKGRSLG